MRPPRHITIAETAARLSCSEETVRRMVRNGRLPALRLNRGLRVDESKIDDALRLSRDDEPAKQ